VEKPFITSQRSSAIASPRPRVRRRGHRSLRIRLARIWTSFRISLDPRTPVEAQLVDAQLRMVRKAGRLDIYILPPLSILIALVNSTWIGWHGPALWCAIVIAGSIGSEIVNRLVEREEGLLPSDVARRAKIFTLTSATFAATWAAMPLAMWAPDQPINHMFLILILASTLASWSVTGAPHLGIGQLPPIFLIASMILSPLLAGGWLNLAIAGMCVGYVILITTLTQSTYETSYKMLRLQFERRGLIANLRRARDESDQARIRAELASNAKSQFLANMSHELRTPMNAILGFSELISAKAFGSSIDKYAEYAAIIHNSGQHLLTLINDILDLAKIEAGRVELSESDIDVALLVDECIRMMANRAETGGITLRTDVRPRLPLLYGDQRAVRQIVVNLLSNAVKFTPSGGRILVFARMEADSRMVIGVEDTGIGIAKEDHARVFESFGQGRHDIATFEKGTGLGLPIVKGLADAHGAEVHLTSEQAAGTRVTVYFPASRMHERPQVSHISTGVPSVASRGWGT
jgi:two-component system cell cycle sensor histidine kinase PleC